MSREPGTGNREPAELMPQVYDELRRLAANYIRNERPGQTLQATALVHEAFLRLSKEKNQPWKNRTHFLAIAALSMRQILVQRARARCTRICRIESAAIARKCVRFFHGWFFSRLSRRNASCTSAVACSVCPGRSCRM